jgi:hypothetical protein
MARSLDQIHKDLKKLAADTAALDKKLRGLYGQYFPVLGAAVRQQLVLAAYHLCTQAYPEAFLALSKAEREKLQESLRKLGRQGQTHIEELVNLDNVSATLSLLLNSKEKRLRAAMVSGENRRLSLPQLSPVLLGAQLQRPRLPQLTLRQMALGMKDSPARLPTVNALSRPRLFRLQT